MRLPALALCALVATPAVADVRAALDEVILPGFDSFAQEAEALSQAAKADCRPGALRPAYDAAFDAWMVVGGLHIGPSETGALPLSFWPDSRGFTPATLTRLIDERDPIGADPASYADVSIAARGFYALDMLMGDDAFAGYAPGSYTCTLVGTIAQDISALADMLRDGWTQDYAEVLLTAGEAGNATYLHEGEAIRALFTQIVTALEFDADTRLGRPMGEFDRPRPRRAEAWRTERPLRNIAASVEANHALAVALSDGDMTATDDAYAAVQREIAKIDDPSFQTLEDDLSARFKLEVLQQAIRALRLAIETEVGAPLGITPGFNSSDGD